MALWTRRCLLSVSLLLSVLMLQAADWLLPLSGRQQFAVCINARHAEITGVCIVKTDSVGESRGAIVNEFGIHAFDFTLSADRRQVRLLNVMPQLDRWYIRRVVRRDLRFLFEATEAGQQKGRRQVAVEPDGTVTLTNTRYKLKYSLKKIDETDE